MEFIKDKYEYMYGLEIHRSLQWHYENTSDEIQEKFFSYLMKKLELALTNEYIIIE